MLKTERYLLSKIYSTPFHLTFPIIYLSIFLSRAVWYCWKPTQAGPSLTRPSATTVPTPPSCAPWCCSAWPGHHWPSTSAASVSVEGLGSVWDSSSESLLAATTLKHSHSYKWHEDNLYSLKALARQGSTAHFLCNKTFVFLLCSLPGLTVYN